MAIDLGRAFHHGVRVADLDAAMAELGPALGLTWAEPQTRDQPVWTPAEGARVLALRFTYSCEGPDHVELLQGPAGTIWDGREHPGHHHVGVWVDDVAASTTEAIDAGWSLVAAQSPAEDGYGLFTYVAPPSGMIVELVSSVALPRFEQWWAGGSL